MIGNELIKTFMDIGVLKFGNFVVKSGGISPIYIDLRCIISYPDLLKSLSKKVWDVKVSSGIDANVICGVPYTALPIATALSITQDIPMIMKRKEAKSYGTKKMIEGVYKKGDRCLVLEDIVTSGSSVLETVEVLQKEGLVISDCIVIINREQGGMENLAKAGIKLHALFHISDILNILNNLELCQKSVIDVVQEYFKQNKFIDVVQKEKEHVSNVHELSETNEGLHPVLRKLHNIMSEKKTNLCVAIDVEFSAELLHLADAIGSEICILKTHIDILNDFDETVPVALRELSKKHNFLIMEDRKFCDIGNTVIHQYRGGLYKIQDWADIITVHTISGEGVIEALKTSAVGDKACVLVAQMSSKGALTTDGYVSATLKMAEKHKDFVIGFISQSRISKDKHFVHMSPGVSLTGTSDQLGQQYRSPEQAVQKDGIDIIIVGRGIDKSCALESAKKYKRAAFKAK